MLDLPPPPDDEDHSNARWFYRRCSDARIAMETPLSTLELALRVLRLVESVVVDDEYDDNDNDDDDDRGRSPSTFQLRLFDELRNGCSARRRDLSFVYDVCDRATELRDDVNFSEGTMRAIDASSSAEEAGRDGGDGDDDGVVFVGRISSPGIADDDADAAPAGAAASSGADDDEGGAVVVVADHRVVDRSDDGEMTTSSAPPAAPSSATTSRSAREEEEEGGNDDDDDDRRREANVDFDGLHCFQLRTRVLGLSLPTFTTELWRYLQLAGWTYSSGKYHIPERRRRRGGRRYDCEGTVGRIYEHFDLDDDYDDDYADDGGRHGTTRRSSDEGEGTDDDEEGPEVFDSPNELIDYLDEYCMPDYRSTTAEVEATRTSLSANSMAYRRRNLRLRLELLEVAYRERSRVGLVRREEEDEEDVVGRSKYGHGHRPCEVCFRGANPFHPRVACRGCGLVVHTRCYGLSDHGEKGGEGRNGAAEVDEGGYFACDVCAMRPVGTNRSAACKPRWQAPQRSGWRVEAWRVHQHPDAVCSICGWKYIAGGMVRIAADEAYVATVPSNDAKDRKRKSRRSSEGSSETWAHLFCINAALPPSKKRVSSGSGRNGVDASVHIRDALDKLAEKVREAESTRITTMRCETCAKGKGDLVQCKGSCGRFYHRLCLQIDCLDVVGWDAKKEHLCLRCRNIGVDTGTSKVDSPRVKSSKAKADNPQVKSSKADAQGGKSAEEVDQYFSRKSGKTSKIDGARSDLVVPTLKECIAEVEILHRQCNVDIEFDKFEVQYQQQFDEWSFSLATRQSILLFGFGSKISLLTRFGNYLAQEGDVMSLNGYDPNVNMSVFLDYMDDLFCDGRESHRSEPQARDLNKGLAKKAASVAKKIALTRSRPLFILIHNIDGLGLRNPFAQDSIATLTANSNKDGSPLIRVVASVDNVNAALVLWSPEVEHKFDWAWKMVHTHRPYFEEVRSIPHAVSSKKVKRRNDSQIIGGDSAALKVLACLAPRHTEVLQALATLQHSSTPKAVSYGMLRDECTRKMLPSSDAVLRNILKELSDHRIVALERGELGNEIVCVPSGILHDILNFKLK